MSLLEVTWTTALGRAIRPAYEGIETPVTRSCNAWRSASCRAIRPAYEGIETHEPVDLERSHLASGRAIRPAYEGIETWSTVAQVTNVESLLSRDPPRL